MGDQIIQVGNVCPTKTRSNPNQGRVYDPQGISPTLSCMGGGNLEPHIIIYDDYNRRIKSDQTCIELLCQISKMMRLGTVQS